VSEQAVLALAQGTRLQLFDTASTAGGAQLQEWQSDAEITALCFVEGSAGPELGVGLRNGLAEVWGVS
jgi:hypothetical protein